MNKDRALLSRVRMLELLGKINDRLSAKNIRGEICLYGGAALILGWNVRETTIDIDATFAPPSEIRRIAADIAEDAGLPDGWLNDGVKGFLSSRGRPSSGRKPFLELSHLSIYIPEPSYLLAMKAMSARTTEEQSDREDVIFLLTHMKIKSAKEALRIVLDYYPEKLVLPKTRYFVESVIAEMKKRR